MRLPASKLAGMMESLDPVERVAISLTMLANDDETGYSAVVRSTRRVTVSMLEHVYVDRMEAAGRAVELLMRRLSVLLTERESFAFAGKVEAERAEAMRRARIEHDPEDALRNDPEALERFQADQGAFWTAERELEPCYWWEVQGLALANAGIAMRYELASIGVVRLWGAFQAFCTAELHANGKTVLRAHMHGDDFRLLLSAIERAQADVDCANRQRWDDLHQPIWQELSKRTRGILDMTDEEAKVQAAARAQVMNHFAGDQQDLYEQFANA